MWISCGLMAGLVGCGPQEKKPSQPPTKPAVQQPAEPTKPQPSQPGPPVIKVPEVPGPEEKPLEKPTEAPAQPKLSEEKPEEKPGVKPAESPTEEKPAEKMPEEKLPEAKPVEKPVEQPPEEKPKEEPAEKMPAEKPTEEKPAEKPEEKPAEKMPEEKLPEVKPVEKPVEQTPEEKPKEKPAEKMPEEKATQEKPTEEKPAESSGEKPSEKMTEEKVAEPVPGPKPQEKAEENATGKPVEKAGAEKSAQEKPSESAAKDNPDKGRPEKPQPKAGEGEQTFRLPDGRDPTDVPAVVWLPKPAIRIPEAEATTEAEMKPYTEIIPGTDVKFDMVPIRGGTFKMGSPENEKNRKPDEGPQVEVRIEPFWMGKCEVTWDEYELWAMGLDKQRRKIRKIAPTEQDHIADAIAIPTKPYTDMTFGMGKEGYPAVCMTQLAAKMYCKWLSAKTGRYYRLPTEAEWEYACRAGTTTAYSFGDDPEKLDEYAWYADNSNDKYQRVGKKKPNPWGLHDMHGNVAEWVLDRYDPKFYETLVGKKPVNPWNPPDPKQEWGRVVRGGSWQDDADRLRSAARTASHKDWKMQDPQIPQSIWYLTDAPFVGFRVVRPLKLPSPEEAQKYDPEPEVVKEYREAQANKM
ncbi:MAG: SUMF1/EgtB/PvdO family nonheme iron enzyme [Thermoguttaceae bacterium]|nr:SUMF1/EgtB/PvdO family nonheme iron enzyme [Thermoguttaceae bacterium]MDW8037336.1 SUMF1/EgtB/PvdO family nonheme iron enzyme [Thermoguttaceae bacterium]